MTMPLHVAQVAGLFTSSALAVGGTVAVAIPIAIHLLTRFRRKPQAWAAMRFLLDAYHKHKRRLQLEQMLLLLVRCLIVLLLGMALAEPLVGGVARWFGARPPGRAVCIVLDDSLTSQAVGGDMKVRFERLRELALATVDQTQPSDQIMFVRSARPVDPALLAGATDHDALRRAIESIKPRHSASALEDALAMAADRIQADVPAGDQVDVVILSDFSGSALDVDKAVPAPITQLAARARMLAPRPQPSAANVQLLDFRPRRSVMLARAEGATSVPVELRLRRFVDDAADTLTGVVVRAFADDSDQPLIEMRREHRWSAGQRVAAVNVELPVQARGTVRLVASIEPGTAHDALDADNHRWALIEL